MLHLGSDHMVPRLKQSLNCHIQAVGGIHGKCHLVRMRIAKQFSQAAPGLYSQTQCLQGRLIASPCRVAYAPGNQSLINGIGNCLRLMQRGGRIVQINHGRTTRSASAMVCAITYILVTPPTFNFSVSP